MYNWRTFTAEQQEWVLACRKARKRPWHSPLHIDSGNRTYHITAACFEHKQHIGYSYKRMLEFEQELLKVLELYSSEIFAWAILPNHYHCLVKTEQVKTLLQELGKLHGKSSFLWNKVENTKGRQNWYNAVETSIKSTGHFYACLNYIHHNPVKHQYVKKWQEWPCSSANIFLEQFGKEKAESVWNSYPVYDYGKEWDPVDL
jgi:REP-associated tyrosine transposase